MALECVRVTIFYLFAFSRAICVHYRWRFNATFWYEKNKLNEKKKRKRNEKEGNTQAQPLAPPPHSYVKHSPLPLYYWYTTSTHAGTHAQTHTHSLTENTIRFDFTIIIGNDAYYRPLSTNQQEQQNHWELIESGESTGSMTFLWFYYFIYSILSFSFRYIYSERDVHVRIGFVPCEFPFRIYGLNHTNKAKHAVFCAVGVLCWCWCVHTYRQLFCHCVWWLPCYSVSSKPYII